MRLDAAMAVIIDRIETPISSHMITRARDMNIVNIKKGANRNTEDEKNSIGIEINRRVAFRPNVY